MRRFCIGRFLVGRFLVGGVSALVVAVLFGGVSSTDATNSAPPAPAISRIVTLGDSYSSGTGIHRHASDYDDHGPEDHSFDAATRLGGSACYRELDSTPGARLAAELGVEHSMVACAGARIAEIANQLQLADLGALGAGVLLTLTIGGNDIVSGRGESWGDVVVRCITTFGCDGTKNAISNLAEVEHALLELYTEVGTRLSDARVRVLGYPRLMQRDRWGCVGVTGVGRSEARWIDGQVDDLNAAIERAVVAAASRTGADLRFVSVVDEFKGHGACRTWQRDRYVNDALVGQTYQRRRDGSGQVTHHFRNELGRFAAASFHPSQRGYDAFGRALAASL